MRNSVLDTKKGLHIHRCVVHNKKETTMSEAFYKFSDIVFPIVRIRIGKDSKEEYLNFLGSGFILGKKVIF